MCLSPLHRSFVKEMRMDRLEVSSEMEQGTQQYLEVAKTGLEAAHKLGLLKTIFSWLPSRKPEHPVQDVRMVDYGEEALKALRENAVDTLGGLTLTVEEAAHILEPGFALDDLDKVNSTWQKHWTQGASRVGIDDGGRRTWWARLLAGEIQQPDTYSLRTLAVMDILSTKEAKLFARLCDYIWNPQTPVVILPSDKSVLWKPDFAEGTLLQSINLAIFDGIAGFEWIDKSTEDEIVRRSGSYLLMALNNDSYLVRSDSKPVRLRCGALHLTDIGQEMYRLTSPNYPDSYRDEIVEEWRQSYTVSHIPGPVVRNL